jgi:hypothetical protein
MGEEPSRESAPTRLREESQNVHVGFRELFGIQFNAIQPVEE